MISVALLSVVLACTLSAASAFVAPTTPFPSTPPNSANSILHPRSRTVVAPRGSSIVANNFDAPPSSDDGNNPVAKKTRLSRALEVSIGWLIRRVVLRRCSSLVVTVDASSDNRALLAGGGNLLSGLSISARDCELRFDLLSLRRLDVSASNLRMGLVPYLLPFLPWMAWRLRGCVWWTVACAQALRVAGCLESGSLSRAYRTGKGRICTALGARPSSIDWSASVDREDVARSAALRFWLQRGVLKSLVENSVVGAAAAVGDAALDADERARRGGKNLLLPSSSSGGKNYPDVGAGGISRPNNDGAGPASALLSATSFELKGVSFSRGRAEFEAVATVPKIENTANSGASSSSEGTLPFAIRARVEPTSSVVPDGRVDDRRRRRRNDSVGFLAPECRLNTGPLTSGTLLGMLVPDVVWIPFGLGVAVSFGEGCRIHRAEVTGGDDGNGDGVCRIDATLDVFQQRTT